MKKLLSLFVLCLMAFLLVGCDQIMDQVKNFTDNNQDDNTEEPAKVDDKANDKLEVSQEQSEAKFEEIAKTGYEVVFTYTMQGEDGEETGTMTMVAKDNTVWYTSEDDGMALVEDTDKYHIYNYEEGAYVFTYSYPKEEGESLFDAYKTSMNPYLYWANQYDGSLKKGADAKVAGRNCHTYSLDMSAILGAYAGLEGIENLKYKIYVDKELGITMKVELAATVEGESSSFSFEVTSFKLGNEVSVPRLPAPVANEEE